jgi:hypothetical protein
MTRYFSERNKFNKEDDTPISIRNYNEDTSQKTYYCNFCNRNLVKLTDSKGSSPSWYCPNCNTEVDPSITEVRSKSPLSVPEGPPEHPLASTKFKEPSFGKTPREYKGAFAALKARGIKMTYYKDEEGTITG